MTWQFRESTRFERIVRRISAEYPQVDKGIVERAVYASVNNLSLTCQYHYGNAVGILRVKGIIPGRCKL